MTRVTKGFSGCCFREISEESFEKCINTWLSDVYNRCQSGKVPRAASRRQDMWRIYFYTGFGFTVTDPRNSIELFNLLWRKVPIISYESNDITHKRIVAIS